jgi:HSP20 family protein
MNRFWRSYSGLGRPARPQGWAVPLDIRQEGDSITVDASVPGVDPEQISATVEDGILTIKGQTATNTEEKDERYFLRERRVGVFHRSVRLPDTVDTDRAETTYENGVLSITFPKHESKKARSLPINVKG